MKKTLYIFLLLLLNFNEINSSEVLYNPIETKLSFDHLIELHDSINKGKSVISFEAYFPSIKEVCFRPESITIMRIKTLQGNKIELTESIRDLIVDSLCRKEYRVEKKGYDYDNRHKFVLNCIIVFK